MELPSSRIAMEPWVLLPDMHKRMKIILLGFGTGTTLMFDVQIVQWKEFTRARFSWRTLLRLVFIGYRRNLQQNKHLLMEFPAKHIERLGPTCCGVLYLCAYKLCGSCGYNEFSEGQVSIRTKMLKSQYDRRNLI